MKKTTPDTFTPTRFSPKWLLLFAFLIFCQTPGLAQPQRRGNIWYFGQNNGLDFSCGRPTKITNVRVSSIEGVTALCDEQGEVLFYSNGGGTLANIFNELDQGRIWNRNQEIMLDLGTTSGGGLSSAQGVMALPDPANPNRYYLFTVDHFPTLSQPTHRGLSYFKIDMAANGGLGAVVTSETRVFNPATECLTAARHSNGQDYWILTIDFDSRDLLAVPVTAQGVQAPIRHPRLLEHFPFILKASPDSRYFCDGQVLYRFDPATSAISDPIILPDMYDYGFTFSPESRYLYTFNKQLPRGVLRYDLQAPDIPGSVERLADLGNAFVRQMHIGPDGSLYFLEENFPNPQIDASAVYCPDSPNPEVERNVVSFVASITSRGFSAMNNLADFWFDDLQHTLEKDTTEQLLCPGTPLILTPECLGETYAWNTGATTNSIVVETPGAYRVSVTNGCYTVMETILVNPGTAPAVQIEHAPVIEICDVLPLTLNALSGDAETFRWSTGDTLASIAISGGGTYRVTVTNTCGEASDEVSWPETPCCRIYAPSAFSPNLDGINDVFKLEPFRCPFFNFRLRIFSRWGELLFETDDPAQGWNGRTNGQFLPQGHYLWMTTYQLTTDAPERVRLEKGGIHLLR